MNYINTFIRVAEDCPVDRSVVPTDRGERKSMPVIQYELLAYNPYRYTQEDLLFVVFVRHKAVPTSELERRGTEMRTEFFSKPQPCLRASPLAKKYGWGLHFNAEGLAALCPMESEEYQRFTEAGSDGPTILKAFRSSRL